jgi:hypothetical protein
MSIISARFRPALMLLVAALIVVFAAVAMAMPASADPTPAAPTSPYPPSLPSSSSGVGGVSSSRAPSVAPASSGLASTGVPTAEYVGVGLLLLVGGVVFVAAGRRGRRT